MIALNLEKLIYNECNELNKINKVKIKTNFCLGFCSTFFFFLFFYNMLRVSEIKYYVNTILYISDIRQHMIGQLIYDRVSHDIY